MKLNVSIDLDQVWDDDDTESLGAAIRLAIRDELVKAARKAVRDAIAEVDKEIRDERKARMLDLVRRSTRDYFDEWILEGQKNAARR